MAGLTVLKEMVNQLPQYDYIYLGDNARAPYGNRSFETVYQYTLQCVQWLFDQGCPLVILACNTASAKALRTIQQNDLPRIAPDNRVLGVIRPTTEVVGNFNPDRECGSTGYAWHRVIGLLSDRDSKVFSGSDRISASGSFMGPTY